MDARQDIVIAATGGIGAAGGTEDSATEKVRVGGGLRAARPAQPLTLRLAFESI